ncbi:hypothetical protein ACIGZJ_30805 [Kitasatospora sp. NPDC052868]|uniref:hypothetical protein n=1 Tax=Kitasatospora sp. NPDC052868 TaxID=3364060 RepID=UPI0037C60316
MSQTTPPGAVPAPQQWVSTTPGRIVTDTYSWLQAVHWVHGAGIAPVPPKGPKFGLTTVRIAQELTKLTEVRPGVAYLMQVLKLGERTVQYHLAHLRATGLLAYIEAGTRLPRTEDRTWVARRTSHFALTVPQAYDQALGIRTTGKGPTRRMTGIAEAGRQTIARLGKLASKAVRRRRKKATASRTRCTPMVGGTATASDPDVPPAGPLEGNAPNRTRQQQTSKTRKGNKITRRFRLAAQLKERVLWLSGTTVARMSWVLSEVSDAGWTVDEVQAWLALRDAPHDLRRGSGLLASRLVGATVVWPTPAARRRAVEASRDLVAANSRTAARVDENFLSAPEHRPSLGLQIITGLRQGRALQSTSFRSRGLDDLSGHLPAQPTPTDDQAAELVAAFLGRTIQ